MEVIGYLSKNKETDPIFLPNEDLRELGKLRKEFSFGIHPTGFPGTPLVRAIKPQ